MADQEAEQGVSDISKVTDISPSSCFNILRTLTDLGLARFNDKTKKYSIGLGIFELARNGVAHDPMMASAQPHLVTVAEKYGAVMGLWAIVPVHHAVLIAMGQNSSAVRIQLQIGSRQPLGAGATGRAHISVSPRREDDFWLKARFDEVNWQGDITFEQYLREIEQARELGYAVDRDAYYPGMSSVAAAFDQVETGHRYCLTAVLLSGAHDNQSIKSIGKELVAITKKLSRLGD